MMEQPNNVYDYTVVVTGVGALIGQGIIKALRRSACSLRIIGVDRNPGTIGTHLSDAFYQKPRCDESTDEYRDFWLNLVRKEQVDLVLPGIEIDVLYLNAHRHFFEESRTTLCLNSASLITISSDKWLLGQELQKHGQLQIPSLLSGDWQQCISVLGPPPLLLKPRQGNGSRGIVRLYDADDYLYWKGKAGDNFMVQKIVGNNDEEYTVGSFGFGDGASVDPIIFKRRLSPAGNTQFARVVQDRALSEMTATLNTIFRPLGPTNYQFRKDGDRVYLLEINPRFSSTVSLRAAFGYNEAAMSLEFFLRHQRPFTPVITPGQASRYTEDFIQYDCDNR